MRVGSHVGVMCHLNDCSNDSRNLTRQRFSSALNGLLYQQQMGTQCYNAHSFHSGAVTTARQANIPDMIIKMLGRWKSDAYQSYIVLRLLRRNYPSYQNI